MSNIITFKPNHSTPRNTEVGPGNVLLFDRIQDIEGTDLKTSFSLHEKMDLITRHKELEMRISEVEALENLDPDVQLLLRRLQFVESGLHFRASFKEYLKACLGKLRYTLRRS